MTSSREAAAFPRGGRFRPKAGPYREAASQKDSRNISCVRRMNPD
jgi:hypothetical protein